MANRTTVKSNIITQNVPTVTNDILTGMLNGELADNVRFREDVAVSQSASASAISVDFTGKDRVDLQRTGGSLNITVSSIGDGETKFLLITKTAGQSVSWAGVTDVTPVKENADALSLVLYEIVRKGSNFFAKAWVETVIAATQAEANGLTVTAPFIAPDTIPISSTGQAGILKIAGAGEIAAGTDSAAGKGNVYAVPPSELKAVKDGATTGIGLKKNRLNTMLVFATAPGSQGSGVVIAGDLANTDYVNLSSAANGWYAMPDPTLYTGSSFWVHNTGSTDKGIDFANLEITNLAMHIHKYGTVLFLSDGAKWIALDWNNNVIFS
jgi:hypothetical protein